MSTYYYYDFSLVICHPNTYDEYEANSFVFGIRCTVESMLVQAIDNVAGLLFFCETSNKHRHLHFFNIDVVVVVVVENQMMVRMKNQKSGLIAC